MIYLWKKCYFFFSSLLHQPFVSHARIEAVLSSYADPQLRFPSHGFFCWTKIFSKIFDFSEKNHFSTPRKINLYLIIFFLFLKLALRKKAMLVVATISQSRGFFNSFFLSHFSYVETQVSVQVNDLIHFITEKLPIIN